MYIDLHCVESNHRNDTWRINIEGGTAAVMGPDGRELTRLRPEQAASVFRLPGFSNGNRFGIRDGKRIVEFEISRDGAEQVRAFLGTTAPSQQHEFKSEFRARGVRGVLFGLCAIGAGVGLSVASYAAASNGAHGGRYTVFTGIFVLGVFWFLRGIQHLGRPTSVDTTM
jgi:hypothetical protein